MQKEKEEDAKARKSDNLKGLDLVDHKTNAADAKKRKQEAKKQKAREQEEAECEANEEEGLGSWERRRQAAQAVSWQPAALFLARLDERENNNTTNANANAKNDDNTASINQEKGSQLFLFALWALQLNVDKASYFGLLPYELLFCMYLLDPLWFACC
jgi:hypothetical protein